jgi:hypothetical protein
VQERDPHIDSYDYAAACDRLVRNTLLLGGLGCVLALVVWEWRSAIGVGMMTGIAWYSVRWFRKLLESIKPDAEATDTKETRFFVFRYVFLGLGIYGILTFLGPQPYALLGGILIAPAAVVLELFYQILYART